MKNFILLAYCLLVLSGKAQTPADSLPKTQEKVMTTRQASLVLKHEYGKTILRRQAIHDLAIHVKEGDAEAMHVFGMLNYLGVDWKQDYEKALKWFEAAARRGYPKSAYNLSSMYRTGTGVEQDFEKAYQYICQAADGGHVQAQYGRGYFLYKGLGCEQSYTKALKYFRLASESGHGYAMYMIGLCYRNGYGIATDSIEAVKWLTKASAKGVKPASEELQLVDPENTDSGTAGSKQANGANKVRALSMNPSSESEKNTPNAFRKIRHQLAAKSKLAGEYTGYAVKYDWSGKHPIAKTRLKLILEQQGDSLIGIWTENDTLQTTVHALIGDTALVFNNTGYMHSDHYNRQRPNVFRFKDALVQLITRNDTIMLAGNIQLFSLVHNEPEKPMYISLTNTSTQQKVVAPFIGDKTEPTTLQRLIAYPNPFKNNVQVDFNVARAGMVTLCIYDASGRQVYTQQSMMSEGIQTLTIESKLVSGTYLLHLTTGTKTEKVLLIKQ